MWRKGWPRPGRETWRRSGALLGAFSDGCEWWIVADGVRENKGEVVLLASVRWMPRHRGTAVELEVRCPHFDPQWELPFAQRDEIARAGGTDGAENFEPSAQQINSDAEFIHGSNRWLRQTRFWELGSVSSLLEILAALPIAER
jgi:hypothetical protein